MNVRRLLAPAAALAVLAVPAWGVSPAHASAADHGTPATQVPAPGPGWYLTIVARGPITKYDGIHARSQRLVLVSPTGAMRTVYTQKVGRYFGGFQLSDWSVDGATALLETTNRSGTRAIRVDVATGATQVLPLDGEIDSMVLTPDGSGLVAEKFQHGSSPFEVERVDWSGAVTRLSRASVGPLLVGPGNTLITTGNTTRQLQVLDIATGAVLRQFRPGGSCLPVRWWDASRVLAGCGNHLALIDPDTGARTPLTTQNGKYDYGHLDAREITSGLYVQVAGACGTTFVSHMAADGSMHMLHVPGAVGNVVMVNGVGRNLVIEHAADCDGGVPRSELSLYNPKTRHEKVLVALGRHEVFDRFLVYGEVRASVY